MWLSSSHAFMHAHWRPSLTLCVRLDFVPELCLKALVQIPNTLAAILMTKLHSRLQGCKGQSDRVCGERAWHLDAGCRWMHSEAERGALTCAHHALRHLEKFCMALMYGLVPVTAIQTSLKIGWAISPWEPPAADGPEGGLRAAANSSLDATGAVAEEATWAITAAGAGEGIASGGRAGTEA